MALNQLQVLAQEEYRFSEEATLQLLETIGADSEEVAWPTLAQTLAGVSRADHCLIWRQDMTLLAQYKGPEAVSPANDPLRQQVLERGCAEAEQDRLILPLLYQGQTIGLIELYGRNRYHRLTTEELKRYQLVANQIAMMAQNTRLQTELLDQQKNLHEISLQLIDAQEEERRRISRELHDELGQALTALKINLEIAHQTLANGSTPQLQNSLAEAKILAGQTLETARQLSQRLRPRILDDLGLVSAIQWDLDRYQERTNQTVELEIELDDSQLNPEVEITLYRIITEALTNVARHAQADRVRVYLKQQDNQIIVGIEDDGQGFDAESWLQTPAKHHSLGLTGMRERVALLEGQFHINSAPGQGTQIQVQLPNYV